MTKLKDDKMCWKGHLPEHVAEYDEPLHTLCRFGCCVILRCPNCKLEWGGWGPVACPCKKNENGTLRWFKYPDMDKKTRAAVKENKEMRKPKRSKRTPNARR